MHLTVMAKRQQALKLQPVLHLRFSSICYFSVLSKVDIHFPAHPSCFLMEMLLDCRQCLGSYTHKCFYTFHYILTLLFNGDRLLGDIYLKYFFRKLNDLSLFFKKKKDIFR